MSKHRFFTISIVNVLKNSFIFLLVTTGLFIGGRLAAPYRVDLETSYALSASAAINLSSEKTFTKRFLNSSSLLYSVMPVAKTTTNKNNKKTPTQITTQPPPSKEVSLTVSDAAGYTPLDGIYVNNESGYSFELEKLLGEDLNLEKGNPMILIIHTHTSESYTPSEGYNYVPSDPYRTEDPKFNITSVGEKTAEALTSRGIGVIHDKTSHDYPSYSGSYNRAMKTIEKNLVKYPSIRFVLDIHRDAISDQDGEYLKTTAEVDEKKCAQLMIAVGTDRGGLEHPNWQQNLMVGLKLQRAIINKYPGLARPLNLREERFNGHTSPGTLLLEVGSNGNTLYEALISAEMLGHCMADMIEAALN